MATEGNRAQAERMGLGGNEFAVWALDTLDRMEPNERHGTVATVYASLAMAAEIRALTKAQPYAGAGGGG